MQTLGLGAVTPSSPANDNALADYLDSEAAQHATPSTLLQVARLAKCLPQVSAEQLQRVQRAIDSA